MFFKVALYLSIALFLLGLLYRVSSWFRASLDLGAQASTPTKRFFAALRGMILTFFSSRGLTLIRVFVREVLFQERTWKESVYRGIMHSCIFWGFWVLFFMHALERFVPSAIFKDYASTLNPFFFLRNLFGLAMLVGMIMAFYRRFVLKVPRLLSNRVDKITMLMLFVILISGFFLEAVKITSYKSYRGMVEDYASVHDAAAQKSLESYWVANFGVVSPALKGPFPKEVLVQGKDVHETSCSSCHSAPQWAFASYGLSRVVAPMAGVTDRAGIPALLWYIHFLTCFAALAYLPFSRMFHIFTTPLSLLANSVMTRERSDPINLLTKQILELDACTHCGTCSTRCSVAIWSEGVPNPIILPSEKIEPLRSLAGGNGIGRAALSRLQNGLCLCTNCRRCTEVCPAGINLQELWFHSREVALGKGVAELSMLSPLSYYRALRSEDILPQRRLNPVSSAREAINRAFKGLGAAGEPIDVRMADMEVKRTLGLSEWGEGTPLCCFTCTTCSSVCPVVRNSPDSPSSIGLTPHQIIHAANLGLPDPIFRSTMLWACTGCYQCQEACPQGVQVADVLYRLKNMAVERMDMKEKRIRG
jgi:heterodisulfide reductase subunit C/nitrate reductase gamma subunit